MHYWLVKSDPGTYSWKQFIKDKRTCWDGVRNYQARNYLKAMKAGDRALFYHSSEGLAVVGIARVVKEAYQDPTTDDSRWVAVDLVPVKTLSRPVSIQDIKEDPRLGTIPLLKQGRLSVMPLSKEEFDIIVEKGAGN
jgi:predicted RNA-binding protein with PUA-like domain